MEELTMENERNFSPNPREIFTQFSGKEGSRVTMAVECHMTKAENPQLLFGSFSRLVFNLIKAGQSVTANVPFPDIADIMERTAYARQKLYDMELDETAAVVAADETLPPAYTVKFTMGEFKGKTPAAVVMEDPEGNRGKLREHYEFLQRNADKYPLNKKIMDAITNAYELLSAGKLEAKTEATNQAVIFTIYKPGRRPLVRKEQAPGSPNKFVYDISVIANLGSKYPVQVEIQNYYAPVKKTESGLYNVETSNMDPNSLKKISAYMTMKDWNRLIYAIADQRAAFIAANGGELMREADSQFAEYRSNGTQTQTQAV